MTFVCNNNIGGKKSTIYVSATDTIIVAGNSNGAGNSAISSLVSNATEVVETATISKVVYTSAPGSYWTISRGSGVIGSYVETGIMDYSSHGASLSPNAASDIVATLVGSLGNIIIEVSKSSSFLPDE